MYAEIGLEWGSPGMGSSGTFPRWEYVQCIPWRSNGVCDKPTGLRVGRRSEDEGMILGMRVKQTRVG